MNETSRPSLEDSHELRRVREHLQRRDFDLAKQVLEQTLQAIGDDEPRMRAELLWRKNEIYRYLSQQDPPKSAPRGGIVLLESLTEWPDTLFVFEHDRRRVLGRKVLSEDWLDDRIDEKFCSRIAEPMLLGELRDQRLTRDGVLLFVRPFVASERRAVFDALLEERSIEVAFPWPPFVHAELRERVSTSWEVDERGLDRLDYGERVLRSSAAAQIGEWLDNEPRDTLVVDPACSTGRFLLEVGERCPRTERLGLDSSRAMVDVAARRIPRVIHADAAAVAKHVLEADVLVARFLNARVVTTQQAHQLFLELAKAVRPGGRMILYGHTPVLLSPRFMEAAGFGLLSANVRRENGVYPMFAIERPAKLRQFRHRWFTG